MLTWIKFHQISCIRAYIIMRGDWLTMGYFDNLDNEPLNKYKKILKIEKSL
jgi:hypothetical protein